jgi:hypothetical protein
MNTTIARLIRIIKKDDFTHAAISLDKQLKYMYSFGRKYTYIPFVGRFIKEDINKKAYKFGKTLYGAVIEIEVSRQQYDKVRTLLDCFISNDKLYKYNFKGLLYNLLGKPACREYRFLCSEFVYHIIKESGITDCGKPRNLVRPQDLYNINGNIIYKGNLRDYKILDDVWKKNGNNLHVS